MNFYNAKCDDSGTTVLRDSQGTVTIASTSDGLLALRGEPAEPGMLVPHSPCITSYPPALVASIFEAYGSLHTCDEISRDTDETEAALDVRYSVSAYLPDSVFGRQMRLLDYGCGAGSSTLTLSRLFPSSTIEGVDFMASFLEIAANRCAHYGFTNARFHLVPPSGKIAAPDATYDMVFLNAVYEHLLPIERPAVLSEVWRCLKRGGILILNQTPHRWFPVEAHTSGLPLINYLPRPLAHRAIARFCRRGVRQASWEKLLRAGVRGASVAEISRHLHRIDPQFRRLSTIRYARTWSGVWFAAKQFRLGKVRSPFVRSAFSAVAGIVRTTGLPFSPYVNVAFSKGT